MTVTAQVHRPKLLMTTYPCKANTLQQPILSAEVFLPS